MSLRLRILIGFLTIYIVGFYVLADSIIDDMRPRYLEAVEESLNDTVNVLAALVESNIRDGRITTGLLERVFTEAKERRFSARIFGYTKRRVGLDVYVTDRRGVILYDSRSPENVGKDFSRWNDVHLTLLGEYGARSTRTDEKVPSSSQLHVAAPIRYRGGIVGVITVIKPHDSVSPFIDIATRKLVTAGIVFCGAIALLSLILSFLISTPLTRLTEYVRSLKRGESARLPRLSGREISVLGSEFQSLWEELKGKKYIEEYLQSLTHELKSPITTIGGSAELLLEDPPEEQRRRFCENIARETRRIQDVVQKMLELSSLENRRSPVQSERIEVRALADEVIAAVGPAVIRKDLTVENLADPSHRVIGERFLVRHALLNLLENAIRHSSPGGRIAVESSREERGLAVSITDGGSGIPDYALDRVFSRFYSLPDPETGKKSTGLGLPFVREVASLHGGTAEVRNNEGGGVTATIVIP
ncbi:MAG: two-component system sensor histidine kinase CreC [Spirochaetes bacterium]|nr:two-component system sensor histidine kinase CreC [Spirochaetota bacterium]